MSADGARVGRRHVATGQPAPVRWPEGAYHEQAMSPERATMTDRIAFSEMAVRVFGLFFEHHFLPEERVVGGGVDTHWIPWPD